jgi:pimeloyl-ACP methyl ester carboxylesterase
MDQFERDGLRFGVVDAGPADAETVVLLHGFPQQPRTFRPLAERLNAGGLRTLVPTQRGYSRTARPKGRRAYTTATVAADVIALLDAARIERAHLVGHDWGGNQAWGVAAWHPDRVASLTVLSTPHPAAMIKAFRTSTQALTSWYLAFYQLPFLPESLAMLTLGKALRGTELPVRYINLYLDAMADRPTLTGGLNWYRALPFSSRPVGRIRVPTTYVWGNRDFALKRHAAELTADYVVGPYSFRELDAGHWLPEAEPNRTAAAILDQVAAAPARP